MSVAIGPTRIALPAYVGVAARRDAGAVSPPRLAAGCRPSLPRRRARRATCAMPMAWPPSCGTSSGCRRKSSSLSATGCASSPASARFSAVRARSSASAPCSARASGTVSTSSVLQSGSADARRSTRASCRAERRLRQAGGLGRVLFLSFELDWDVRLLLRHDEVPPTDAGAGQRRLGMDDVARERVATDVPRVISACIR